MQSIQTFEIDIRNADDKYFPQKYDSRICSSEIETYTDAI